MDKKPNAKSQLMINGLRALFPCAIFLWSLFPPATLAQSGLSITQQPASQTVVLGTGVTLQVVAAGAGPLTYQWQCNGVNLPNNVITTVAGGWVGDGGMATNAVLNHPAGVALDAAGNLYIAAYYDNRVRKVDTNGIITTVAGDGSGAYSGDGGAATNASLNDPAGVAVDALGNVFIADEDNERIRKVDTNGIITTVAGGVFGYSGNGGPATKAGLATPADVAVDAFGNLFIADFGNDVIRKVNANGIISTVAGIGESFGFSGDGGPATAAKMGPPNSVKVDASGNLFITDVDHNRVRKVATNGIITTVAGNGTARYSGDGGQAANASLNAPSWAASDSFGNLWIADTSNERIRMVGTNGIINTVAGDGTEGFSGDGGAATNANLGDPDGLVLDPSGNLFIGDWLNNRVRMMDTNGIITTVAGSGAGGYAGENVPATDASLWSPYGVAVDALGNFFIADEDNDRIRKVDTNGIITTVAGNGSIGYSGDGGQATNANVGYPADVAVDASGNIFIAQQFNYVIREVQTNGIIFTVAGNGNQGFSGDGGAATNASLAGPTGVAVDVFGNIFIADEANSRVRKVGVNGIITTVAGNGNTTDSGDGGQAANAGVVYPNGVAVDASSNLFIAESTRIRKVNAAGIISTVAGNGTSGYAGDGGQATAAKLSNPAKLTVDASGNIFIADTYTNRIRKVGANGIISTIAGNGSPGYSGDGGLATNASLAYPSGVAVDPSGNVFIADWFNNRIRKVAFGGAPALSLKDVSVADGGNYQVIITGPQGSVTSAVATVTVVLPPLEATLNAASNALLTFGGAAGSLYVLQAATSLSAPINWQPVFTNTADSNGNWTFTATNLSGPALFYRLALP